MRPHRRFAPLPPRAGEDLLLESINDSAAGEVVVRHLHADSVAGEDSDVVHAHFAADMREDLDIAFFELHSKAGVREVFDDGAFNLDSFFFIGLWFVLRSFFTHSFLF